MILSDQFGPTLPSGMPFAASFGSGLTVPVTGTTTLQGTNVLSGATTISGALTVTGATAFTGTVTGIQFNAITGTADVVLTAAQSGSTVYCSKASGNQLVTLPAKAPHLVFTLVCANTATGMTLKTGDATSVIHAKASASGAAIVSTANTGSIVNTQGTAVLNDTITVECDGSNWWMVAQSGIFAAT